ncbi:hypothetical protein [Nocardia jiangxiensis]|uniref:hypothetical protein n=1 Tax=Nocardia jiangxiensis TaxID=282685 RepID=UPI000319817C|nr:hypothetical protein [Nocardia jiangxiensis]
MRITRPLTPLFGALVVSASLGAGLLTPSSANADTPGALAAVPVAAETCGHTSPTFDDVVTSAASAIRTVIPANRLAGYDRQVNDFRCTIATVRVHRDELPTDPTHSSGRLGTWTTRSSPIWSTGSTRCAPGISITRCPSRASAFAPPATARPSCAGYSSPCALHRFSRCECSGSPAAHHRAGSFERSSPARSRSHQ